jgi:hypothetical protein
MLYDAAILVVLLWTALNLWLWAFSRSANRRARPWLILLACLTTFSAAGFACVFISAIAEPALRPGPKDDFTLIAPPFLAVFFAANLVYTVNVVLERMWTHAAGGTSEMNSTGEPPGV